MDSPVYIANQSRFRAETQGGKKGSNGKPKGKRGEKGKKCQEKVESRGAGLDVGFTETENGAPRNEAISKEQSWDFLKKMGKIWPIGEF